MFYRTIYTLSSYLMEMEGHELGPNGTVQWDTSSLVDKVNIGSSA